MAGDSPPPVEPFPSTWKLPDPMASTEMEMVGVGADLEPGTLLAAYRSGMFPMPLQEELRDEAVAAGMTPIGWFSPDPRGILPLDGLRVSRSLRKSAELFEIRTDTAFIKLWMGAATPAALTVGSTKTSRRRTFNSFKWAGPTASKLGTASRVN